jgi:glycosyltransferase involved in cell wall biosynthesis
VSIVVPTYNRLPRLKRLLAVLGQQEYPADQYEVIVVDDGSGDGTAEWLAAQVGRWEGRLRPISQANRGPAVARNRGIAESRGEIAVLIDDDCLPTQGWLPGLLAGFTAPEIGGVGGMIEGAQDGTLFETYLHDSGIYTTPETHEGRIIYLITANAAFRREALLAVGGFTEALKYPGGEDVDLGLRLTAAGYVLRYCPEAGVRHYHRSGLAGFLRTFVHYGQGAYYCCVRHGYPPLGWPVYVRVLSLVWWPVSVVRRLREGWGLVESLVYPVLRSLQDVAYVWGILTGRRSYGV